MTAADSRRPSICMVFLPLAMFNEPEAVSGSLQMGNVVTIRGHHLFDMLDALGTGKSAHKTLGPVAQRIRAQPKAPIKLVIGVDDICNPCASWDHEKGRCTKSLDKYPQDNQNSLTSDTNAIRVLGLKPGDVVRADELYRPIKAKITKKVFAEQVCVACRLVDKCKETYEAKIAAAVAALSWKASEIRLSKGQYVGVPSLEVAGRTFPFDDGDFAVDGLSTPGITLQAEIVFLGYGISALWWGSKTPYGE